jgi:hypothetical protein
LRETIAAAYRFDGSRLRLVRVALNVGNEVWTQPRGERTVLTKNKILTVEIEWLRVEPRRNAPDRYVLSAAMYQRLVDAVKA